MDWLAISGIAICLVGLAGVIHSLIRVTRLRRATLPDPELRDELLRLVPINVGSLLLAVLGLCMLVFGLVL